MLTMAMLGIMRINHATATMHVPRTQELLVQIYAMVSMHVTTVLPYGEKGLATPTLHALELLIQLLQIPGTVIAKVLLVLTHVMATRLVRETKEKSERDLVMP